MLPLLGYAELSVEDIAIRALPGTTIDSAEYSEAEGLIEVVAGKNVLYLTENGKHLIVGHVYDLSTREDLTAKSKTNLNKKKTDVKVSWSTLPQDLMIEYGNGKHHIAIYSDVNCGYCKRLHSELKKHKNLFTVKEIVYPISGNLELAAQILCSEHPNENWGLAMQGVIHQGSDPGCVQSKRERLKNELVDAQAAGIYGTPIIISNDGRVHRGALDIQSLISWLEEAGV